ncbi:MAG: tRNA lysidine(34) synthetase TilS [Hyphomicrobium sp.]
MSRFDEAISAGEADSAFECLRPFTRVVLAVSGGPDSLALLYLAADWRRRLGANGPALSVVTVDHGLRAEAAHEAAYVAQLATGLGLAHQTLHWTGDKPRTGLPNAARSARYALLDAHVQSIAQGGCAAIVTAHHQDDQAETFFMRLARGGGVDALAAMTGDRVLSGTSPVRLLRPLLAFSKARMIASLVKAGVIWIDDPTNSDVSFERARVRAALDASGLEAAPLAMTARRMREARAGLAYAMLHFKPTLALDLNGGVFARFERRAFDDGPRILRQMVVSELIGAFGGASRPPELSEIEALAVRLEAPDEIAVTLGGAMISAGMRYVRVWREPGRLSVPELTLTAGQRQLWDERFWVGYDGDAATAVKVGPLGRAGYDAIAADVADRFRPPAGAAYGLPAFFADGALLAVPALGLAPGFTAMRLTPDLERLTVVCDPVEG